MKIPRIALFADSCNESNAAVDRTTFAIENCAQRRNIPLLSVHAGSETRFEREGSLVRLEIKRSRAFSLRVDGQLRFDMTLWRHIRRVAELMRWFAPDVLHVTGPGDVSQLGAFIGRRLNIPIVGSWHNDVPRADTWLKQQRRRLLMLFYTIPRVNLAPGVEAADLLERVTGKPTFVMSRGVSTEVFRPARRRGTNAIVNIGYVGPLSTEANVRLLPTVESELDAEGLDVRFTIIGDGAEREWLQRRMLRAEFTGLLSGDSLADAYANMDILAIPSKVDAGAALLQAMASGVPAVIMRAGGRRFSIDPGDAAIFADSPTAFVQGVRTLVRNRRRREMMGHDARARAAVALSWDRVFIDVSRAYDAAINASENGPHEIGKRNVLRAS